MKALTEVGDTTINGINAVLGVVLLISPWLLGFAATEAAAWTAGLGGLVIAVVSFSAFIRVLEWEEWVNLATGLGVTSSPWLFGFAGQSSAMWAHVLIGLIVTAVAIIELWRFHGAPPTRPA